MKVKYKKAVYLVEISKIKNLPYLINSNLRNS